MHNRKLQSQEHSGRTVFLLAQVSYCCWLGTLTLQSVHCWRHYFCSLVTTFQRLTFHVKNKKFNLDNLCETFHLKKKILFRYWANTASEIQPLFKNMFRIMRHWLQKFQSNLPKIPLQIHGQLTIFPDEQMYSPVVSVDGPLSSSDTTLQLMLPGGRDYL